MIRVTSYRNINHMFQVDSLANSSPVLDGDTIRGHTLHGGLASFRHGNSTRSLGGSPFGDINTLSLGGNPFGDINSLPLGGDSIVDNNALSLGGSPFGDINSLSLGGDAVGNNSSLSLVGNNSLSLGGNNSSLSLGGNNNFLSLGDNNNPLSLGNNNSFSLGGNNSSLSLGGNTSHSFMDSLGAKPVGGSNSLCGDALSPTGQSPFGGGDGLFMMSATEKPIGKIVPPTSLKSSDNMFPSYEPSRHRGYEESLQLMASTFLSCLSASTQMTVEVVKTNFIEVKDTLKSIQADMTSLKKAMNVTGQTLLNQHADQSFCAVDSLEALTIHVIIKHLPSIGNGVEIGWPTIVGEDVFVVLSVRVIQYILTHTYHRKATVDMIHDILTKYDIGHLGTKNTIIQRATTWFPYFGLDALKATYVSGKKQFKKINLKTLLQRVSRPNHAEFSPVVIETKVLSRKPFARARDGVNRQGPDRVLHTSESEEALAYSKLSEMLCAWYLTDTKLSDSERAKAEQALSQLNKCQGYLQTDFQVIPFI